MSGAAATRPTAEQVAGQTATALAVMLSTARRNGVVCVPGTAGAV